MDPESRSSFRLRLVAACEQHSGTIALASQNAIGSPMVAVFAERGERGPDRHPAATRSPECGGQRPLRLSEQAGRDQRFFLRVVIDTQRNDLRDRALPIPDDDLFPGPHFAQVLRQAVSELRDVCASHAKLLYGYYSHIQSGRANASDSALLAVAILISALRRSLSEVINGCFSARAAWVGS
jgi:hypothetical protein